MYNRIWLIDLVNAVRPISETYFVLYTKQVNNTEKALLLEYRKVVIELREVFANLLTKVDPLATARGNIFNVDFGGSEEDISTTEGDIGRGNSLSCSRKREGINSIKEETSRVAENPIFRDTDRRSTIDTISRIVLKYRNIPWHSLLNFLLLNLLLFYFNIV